MEAATGNERRPAVLWNVQLQRERRPQTATTRQAWYRNHLVQIRWCHTVKNSLCLAYTENAVSRGRQTRGRIATKLKYQMSCGVRRRGLLVDVVQDRQEARQTWSCHKRAWSGRTRPRDSESSRCWRQCCLTNGSLWQRRPVCTYPSSDDQQRGGTQTTIAHHCVEGAQRLQTSTHVYSMY